MRKRWKYCVLSLQNGYIFYTEMWRDVSYFEFLQYLDKWNTLDRGCNQYWSDTQ